ncbi:Molybdenum-pterin-binding protein MopA [compost metagenome]
MFPLKIKSKIWIETEEGILISEGRIQLLKLIDATGSLNKAAKAMNISYQKAWKLVDASNKASSTPLIETQVGGSKGGGTVLTPYGKSLIESFEAINAACWGFLDAELKKYSL